MAQLQQGQIFHDRYELLRQIGVGGFAVVWKVRDVQTDLFWAIKVYAPEHGLDDSGVEAFKADYQRTQHLNHPRLLTPNHFNIADGSPYLVMELCEKGSLEVFLQQHLRFSEDEKNLLMERGADDMLLMNLHNRLALRDEKVRADLASKGILSEEEGVAWAEKTYLSEAIIAKIMHDVGEALHYLHHREPQLLHRDIKTGNILIDDHGNYLVTDFGISSRVKKTLRKATSQASAISVSYAPPERFEARPVSVPEGDIFSLGVMLYELCEGDVPWDGTGGMALMQGAPLPELPDFYTNRLGKIVKSCMHPEYAKRPSAERLQALATGFLKDGFWEDVPFAPPAPRADQRKTVPMDQVPMQAPSQPVSSGKATQGDGAPKKKKSKKGLVVLLLLLVFSGVGGGGYLWWEGEQEKQAFRKLINEGNRMYDTDQLLEARVKYEEAQRLFPGNPEVARNIKSVDKLLERELEEKLDSANYLMERKNYAQAVAVLERAKAYGPENEQLAAQLAGAAFIYHRAEGDKYMRSGNYTDAEAQFIEALKHKEDKETQQLLADVQSKSKAEMLAQVNSDLLAAVKADDVTATQKAIQAGANVNLKDGSGIHIVYWAVHQGNLPVLKTLAEAGAKCVPSSNPIRIGNVWLGHPAIIAAYHGKKDMLEYMLSSCGVSINDQEFDPVNNQKGWHALGAAAYQGHIKLLEYLIGKGAKVDLSYDSGRTALFEAATQGHYDATALLLKKGASVKSKDGNGRTAYALTSNSRIKGLMKQYGAGGFSYVNTFTRPDSHFGNFKTKQRELSVSQGVYTVNALEDGYCYDEASAFDIAGNRDFEARVDVKWEGGRSDAPFGLILGANGKETSYYVLQISGKGGFSIMQLDNGSWKTVVKWTNGKANRGSKWNSLKVVRKGKYMTFFINGKQMERIRAPRLSGSKFGLMVCNRQKVSFDNFKLEGEAR